MDCKDDWAFTRVAKISTGFSGSSSSTSFTKKDLYAPWPAHFLTSGKETMVSINMCVCVCARGGIRMRRRRLLRTGRFQGCPGVVRPSGLLITDIHPVLP